MNRCKTVSREKLLNRLFVCGGGHSTLTAYSGSCDYYNERIHFNSVGHSRVVVCRFSSSSSFCLVSIYSCRPHAGRECHIDVRCTLWAWARVHDNDNNYRLLRNHTSYNLFLGRSVCRMFNTKNWKKNIPNLSDSRKCWNSFFTNVSAHAMHQRSAMYFEMWQNREYSCFVSLNIFSILMASRDETQNCFTSAQREEVLRSMMLVWYRVVGCVVVHCVAFTFCIGFTRFVRSLWVSMLCIETVQNRLEPKSLCVSVSMVLSAANNRAVYCQRQRKRGKANRRSQTRNMEMNCCEFYNETEHWQKLINWFRS